MSLRLFVAVFLLGVSIGTRSEDNHHTLWTVKGNHNTVYLLGSVHVLKAADSDLPPEAVRAYASAKALVMEINLNEVSTNKLLGSALNLKTLPAGETLAGALGPDVYNKFAAHAKPLGLDPEFLSHFQPWFAVQMLNQLEVAKLGFDPNSGVELQLAKRAQTDHKDIIGLETIEEQVEIFAHLSLDEQRHYVLYSLANGDNASRALDAVVSAWRTGDINVLEQLVGEGPRSFDLYRKLTTDRTASGYRRSSACSMTVMTPGRRRSVASGCATAWSSCFAARIRSSTALMFQSQ
jgi:uncharacterized protein YbaP (TraB family)